MFACLITTNIIISIPPRMIGRNVVLESFIAEISLIILVNPKFLFKMKFLSNHSRQFRNFPSSTAQFSHISNANCVKFWKPVYPLFFFFFCYNIMADSNNSILS